MWSRGLLVALRPVGRTLQLAPETKETINRLGLRRLRRGRRAGQHNRRRARRHFATETANPGNFPCTATRSTGSGHIPVIVSSSRPNASNVKRQTRSRWRSHDEVRPGASSHDANHQAPHAGRAQHTIGQQQDRRDSGCPSRTRSGRHFAVRDVARLRLRQHSPTTCRRAAGAGAPTHARAPIITERQSLRRRNRSGTRRRLVGAQCTRSFEHLCARLVVQGSACTVLLIYRPGSAAVDSLFFEEFSSLFDDVATRSEPVIIAGDFSMRLDLPDSCDSRRLLDVLDSYGLRCRVSSTTHDRGGILDVVATRTDLDTPDVGISDHRLLRWSCQLERPPPVYHTSMYRPWRRVNADEFKASLRQSTLCTDLSATWRHWPFGTCPPRLTQSIIVSCFVASASHMASVAWR